MILLVLSIIEAMSNAPNLSDSTFKDEKFSRSISKLLIWFSVFGIVYLICLGLSAMVLIGTLYLGMGIITVSPSVFGIFIAFTVAFLGILTFVFFIKFLFAKTNKEEPLRRLVNAEEMPELLSLVHEVSDSVGTVKPRNIYLIPEVNAKVSYKAGFWSLIFPIKKDLEIGIGLMQSINRGELRSILAHEFGHFTQKSIRMGGYVNVVNKVIFNLLYTNDSWNEWLVNFGRSNLITRFMAEVVLFLVKAGRKLLQLVYDQILKRYMELSREMEFHADLVAVTVAGNANYKSSMKKLELASQSTKLALNYLGFFTRMNLYAKNAYPLMQETEQIFRDELDKRYGENKWGLTDIDKVFFTIYSKLEIKDAYATHPSNEERKANSESLQVESIIDERPAIDLLVGLVDIELDFTEKLYTHDPDSPAEKLTRERFIEEVKKSSQLQEHPSQYLGFYDDRNLFHFDDAQIQDAELNLTFEEIFNDKNVTKFKEYLALENDGNILNQLSSKAVKVSRFQYDGRIYKRKDAQKLANSVFAKKKSSLDELIELEKQAFLIHFIHMTESDRSSFLELRKEYFSLVHSQLETHKLSQEFTSYFQYFASQGFIETDNLPYFMQPLRDIDYKVIAYLEHIDYQKFIEKVHIEGERELIEKYKQTGGFDISTTEYDEEAVLRSMNAIQLIAAYLTDQAVDQFNAILSFQDKVYKSSIKDRLIAAEIISS